MAGKKPNPVDTHVGSRVRLRRMLLGMSQERLGDSMGLTFQQVQKYERGINRMSASRLYDFSRVLSVPVAYFFDGYNESLPGQAPMSPEYKYGRAGVAESADEEFDHEQILTRETLELMRCYHRIKNPAVKRRFVDLLRAVSDDKVVLEEVA